MAFIYFSQSSPSGQKAVIIDQGILTVGPNPLFIENITNTLEEAGYKIDYYEGGEVTVDFYRGLPKRGYSLIILRAHSRPNQIYTGQEYDESKYIYEQINEQLVHVMHIDHYFGITPKFVKECMRGRFKNTTIIMMGCDGLSEDDMADAFVNKGAKVFIGWRQSVLVDHSEHATIQLLEHLITERKTIEQAVTETMEEIGKYPILAYYPLEVGDDHVLY